MGAIEQVILTMEEMGFNVFLPWLLIFSVTYGLLNKYEPISEETQVNGVISLAFAFLSVIGVTSFAPAGMWTHFASAIAFGIFGMLSLMILFAVAGYDLDDMGEAWSLPWIFAGVIGVVAFVSVIVGYGGGTARLIGQGNLFDQVVMPILSLVFVIIIVLFTTQDF
ncbi:hypothetical protein GKQ38_05170 [Candidatus Nanohaloarchaea archaeon]|nr:hypothetical protein GKQ38_05170 [Candidatus Nanohaloarchaea archaeon]